MRTKYPEYLEQLTRSAVSAIANSPNDEFFIIYETIIEAYILGESEGEKLAAAQPKRSPKKTAKAKPKLKAAPPKPPVKAADGVADRIANLDWDDAAPEPAQKPKTKRKAKSTRSPTRRKRGKPKLDLTWLEQVLVKMGKRKGNRYG